MAQQTTALGVPYYPGTDPPAGFTQQQVLAEYLDANPGVGSFTQTQIDAFTTVQKRAGRVIFNQTTQKLQKSNGSTWEDLDPLKAPLASPALTGVPTAPTAAVDTSTTQLATTEFVTNQASASSPVMDGTAAVGTSKRFARQDHVHPTDTSRAPLASPGLTGTPTAPTAAIDTETTQVATTAFVLGQAGSATPAMNGAAAVGTSKRFARQDHVHASDTSKADVAPTQNTQTGTGASAYTFALADASRLTLANCASPATFTVPPQASVAWGSNAIIQVTSIGAGVVTIAGGAGVTVTNASATLSQFQSAALIRTGLNAWTVVPFSGVGSATYSATTGSPTVDTTSRPGKTIVIFNGSGSVTVDKAGLVQVLVVGGGGGGGGNNQAGGGGGGGGVVEGVFYFEQSTTFTVQVGSGGGSSTNTYGSNGTASWVARQSDNYSAITATGGGGGGDVYPAQGGGSGGGGGRYIAQASGISNQGNSGAAAADPTNGVGGGGGGAGAAASGRNGGSGKSSSATGTSVAYAGGGGAGAYGGQTPGTGGTGGGGAGAANTAPVAANNGSANTGGGGGGNGNAGGGATAKTGGSGGSGRVILVFG